MKFNLPKGYEPNIEIIIMFEPKSDFELESMTSNPVQVPVPVPVPWLLDDLLAHSYASETKTTCRPMCLPQCLLDRVNDSLNPGPPPDIKTIGPVLYHTPGDDNGYFPVYVSNNLDRSSDLFKKRHPDLAALGYNNILMAHGDSLGLKFSR
jgi:hypothetical protein